MKYVVWFVVVLALGGIGYGVWKAGEGEVPPPSGSPQIVFKGGKIFGRRITTRSWSADYDRIVSNGDQTVLDVLGVKNGLVYRNGKPYLAVRATHLTVNAVSHDFSALGPLRISTLGPGPKRTIETDSATWNNATQTMLFDRPTTISSGLPGEPTLRLARAVFNVKTGQLDIGALSSAPERL